jgi:hypothetical protein
VISAPPCPVFAAFGAADHIISIAVRFDGALEADRPRELRDSYHEDIPNGWLNVTMPGRYRKPTLPGRYAFAVGDLRR